MARVKILLHPPTYSQPGWRAARQQILISEASFMAAHKDPDLASLRGYPPFEALFKPTNSAAAVRRSTNRP